MNDHRAIGVVERMIQILKRRLAVMRIDKTNTPYKLATDVAEIIKTLRNKPHGVTKISPFDAHMGRKPYTPLSNLATNSSPNNLNWENAKHACLDCKNLTKPPLPTQVMHDLQRWSEDEVSINKRDQKQQMPRDLTNSDVLYQKLDEENLAISLDKCKFSCKQVEWLGFSVNSEGTKPLVKKTEAIEKLSPPKNFKQLKNFMGSIHHLTRHIPKLAQTAAALRPLLKTQKKNRPLEWSTEHNTTFNNILKLVSEITHNKHFDFDQHLDTRIVCDASITGLGAVLKQFSPEGWVAVAYASRFLNSLEEKYSVNELELLGVVWAIEHFKYYLYGNILPSSLITKL